MGYFGEQCLTQLSNKATPGYLESLKTPLKKSDKKAILKAVKEIRAFKNLVDEGGSYKEMMIHLITEHDDRTNEIMEIVRRANEKPTKKNLAWLLSMTLILETGEVAGFVTGEFLGNRSLRIRERMD